MGKFLDSEIGGFSNYSLIFRFSGLMAFQARGLVGLGAQGLVGLVSFQIWK